MSVESGTEEFRARASAWLAEHAPRAPITDLGEARAFQARLHDAGFAGITWPREYGGQGLTPAEQRAFAEEAAAYELPGDPFLIGAGMAGPTILDLGTEEQKRRFLPPLLRGAEIWCQLFSEPGAGSDVAGLRTRAVRDGDQWLVDGQKVWTSRAQFADRGVLIARTDPSVPKHRGITMFLVDMHAPGVTVRPLRDMTGGSRFNEVFFDGVRLPADAVLGEAGAGWAAAIRMLGHERVAIGDRIRPRDHAASYASLSAPAGDDPAVRRDLARLYVTERVTELFATRLGEEARAGREPGARGSVGKLAGARLARLSADVAVQAAGPSALAWEEGDTDAERLAYAVNDAPSARIAGGTDEIQRTIIADRVLGLPREPAADRDVPFNEVRKDGQS